MFSNTAPPAKLMDLMPRIKSPVLFIHNGRNGEQINHRYSRAVRAPKGDWIIPEAAHTGGSTARPQEYERRVVGFFDQALLKRRSP